MAEDAGTRDMNENPSRHAYATPESAARSQEPLETAANEPGVEEPHVSRSAYRPDEPKPFVRERAPHHTQPPVNDLQADDAEQDYSYESSYTYSRRGPITSHTYRRSRSNVKRAKQELKYGQYLSVPKGSREIFGTRDRVHRKQMVAAGVAVVAIVVIILLVLLMPH